jgi:hypothetical protein
MLMHYKDSPDPAMVHGTADKVMHASFRIGDSTVLASDGRCQGQPGFHGFSLSLTVADDAEAERRFAALAEGAKCRCRSPRPSSPRTSARSPTASGSPGWSSRRLEDPEMRPDCVEACRTRTQRDLRVVSGALARRPWPSPSMAAVPDTRWVCSAPHRVSPHAARSCAPFGISEGLPSPGSNFGVGDKLEILIEAETTRPATPWQ